MTKITNSAFSGPIRLKIGQRRRFPPDIPQSKFHLSSFNGQKVIKICIYPLKPYVNCFNNTAKGAKGQCQTWDNKETECWEGFKQGPVTVNNKGLTYIQN